MDPDLAAELERSRVEASMRLAARRQIVEPRPSEPAVTRSTTVSETTKSSKAPDTSEIDTRLLGGAADPVDDTDDLTEEDVLSLIEGYFAANFDDWFTGALTEHFADYLVAYEDYLDPWFIDNMDESFEGYFDLYFDDKLDAAFGEILTTYITSTDIDVCEAGSVETLSILTWVV